MRKWLWILALMAGCAALERDCTSMCASGMGADWLVAQYRFDGEVMRCWKLPNSSITSESTSDGIYWLAPTAHMVHVAGWYNYVQVKRGAWDTAAQEIGVDLANCR